MRAEPTSATLPADAPARADPRGILTMFERFTDKARAVVIAAKTKAQERGDDQIRPAHMLYGLAASDGVAARALTVLGVDAAAVERELGRAGTAGRAPGGGALAD